MTPRRGGLVLAAACLWLAAASAWAAPRFPPLTGRVVDDAALLSPAAEQQITAELADLEAKTGRQLVVATVPDLQGYEIEDYGYQLGRAWGIGDKVRNDGVVLLVAPKERRVRIEVGYGLEGVLTDALSNVIIQEKVLPAFREGRPEAGILAGAQALVAQLSLPDDQARARAVAAPARSQPSGDPIVGLFVLLLVFWIVGGVLRGFGGRRGGGGLWWLLPLLLSSSSSNRGSRGGGGFGGGGGSFGGGGSSGSW